MIPGRCRSSHNWHRSTTSHIGNVHASAFLLNPLRLLQCKRLEGLFVGVRETVQGHLRHLRLQLIAFPIVGTCVIAITKCITKTWRNWFLLTRGSLQPLGVRWCDKHAGPNHPKPMDSNLRQVLSQASQRNGCKMMTGIGNYNSMNTTEPKALH